MTSYRNRPQPAALLLSVLLTVATLGGLAAQADGEYRVAAADHAETLAQAEVATPVQQVVVTGRRVQQVVVTGHRRS